MIKELYIDGYLVDIDDNFSIVRQLTSPFFSDVTQLKNNGSYSTKIPETQNNSFIMDYLEREDADTTFPYRGHTANYYEDSFPVFENAEVRVIDAFELQFVWGLNRGKYLPLFTRRLNEIMPNGTTILESDWVVPWKKSNVVYATGKKYKYINYISGERESEVKIIDGKEQPLTEAPEPFLSNLKEMTMHPFVKFTDILDLVIADHNANVDNVAFAPIEKTKEIAEILTAPTIKFVESVDDIIEGCLLKSTNVTGDISSVGIRVISVDRTNKTVTFSQEIIDFDYWSEIYVSDIITFQIKELDYLKTRIGGKGLILNGDKGYIESEFEKNYPLDLDYQFKTDLSLPIDTLSDTNSIIITYGSNYGGAEYKKNRLQINNSIGSIKEPFILNLVFDITISLDSVGIKIVKYKTIIDSPYYEIVEETTITGGVNINIGGWDYIQYSNISVEAEINSGYWYRIELMATTTSYRAVVAGSKITFSYQYDKSFYESSGMLFSTPFSNNGLYNCLMNLPNMTAADFINQMLIMTGLFVGHDTSGNMKFLSLDNFKANLLAGNINDWSGKVSQRKKSYFQFNSNAQNNWIKFANSDDRTYTAKDSIIVDDTTLDTEKDLYTISFDLAEQAASGMAEFILYKQKVASSGEGATEVKTFSNEYSSKNDVCVYDDSGTAIVENVLPNGTNGFVTAYYEVFKDIIYRPRVLDIVVKLDFLETLNIDFEKPVYISDYGKYAVLLDIKIPNDGLCDAKLLLINQTL